MISWLHPWVLALLPLAALPVILHLLKRREPPTQFFPAVRYLRATTEEHQRKLRLENILLLIARTLLVLSLLLLAAGPSVPLTGVSGHAPTALVIVLDNSASSGAIVNGAPRLDGLRRAASRALARATPDDALWLLTADGTPRRGDASALAVIIDSLGPSPARLDLGEALRAADELLSTDRRPGEVLLVTDLQRSAASAATLRSPVTVGRPEEAPPVNRSLTLLDPGTLPWSRGGGRLTLALGGDDDAATPVTVRLAGLPPRQLLGRAGALASVNLPAPGEGWWRAEAELDPDEFLLDDRRVATVRVAPLARTDCSAGGRNVVAACDVLVRNGRLLRGSEVTVGSIGTGPSVVLPPADPADLGAVNRRLAQRGSSWQFGTLLVGGGSIDSAGWIGRHRVERRYSLRASGSGMTGVLATADGQPWAVRSGDIVLLGSRLEPEWTDLPLSAEFMPFMDRLVNRTVRGAVSIVDASPASPARLPDLVTEVRRDDRQWTVDGGDFFSPPETGVYLLVAGRDTVGALDVNVDARETQLEPLADGDVRRLWGPGARVVDLTDAGAAAFSARARGDLRPALIWLALGAGLVEVLLASFRRRGA